jgi:uncharacterized protein
MALLARHLEAEVRDVLASSRAAAILGPRQAGKSTLARQLQESGLVPHFYSLDEEAVRAAAQADPDGFVADIDKPAVIDEVQRAPELLLAIKQAVDSSDERGQFLLTGSANLLASRIVADALPGRVEYVNLWPFSQGEIEGRREQLIDRLLSGEVPQIEDAPRGRAAHADRIVRGGFPDAWRRKDRQRSRYFLSYLRAVLSRDLPSVGDVRSDHSKIERLLRLLAARSGNVAVSSNLGRELELDGKTVKAYVSLLEQLFLVYELRPWSRNLGSRHVKAPKLLLADTGLMSALVGADARRYAAVDQGELAGMLLETFVVMEVVKQSGWSDALVELFYYRDTQQREVDLVIESATGDVAGIEVKAAASVDRNDIRGLSFLRDRLKDRFAAGIVLYAGAHTLKLDERIWAVPLEGLWA